MFDFSRVRMRTANCAYMDSLPNKQACTQTFEKGGAYLRNFTMRSASLKKILILRPK